MLTPKCDSDVENGFEPTNTSCTRGYESHTKKLIQRFRMIQPISIIISDLAKQHENPLIKRMQNYTTAINDTCTPFYKNNFSLRLQLLRNEDKL